MRSLHETMTLDQAVADIRTQLTALAALTEDGRFIMPSPDILKMAIELMKSHALQRTAQLDALRFENEARARQRP